MKPASIRQIIKAIGGSNISIKKDAFFLTSSLKEYQA